MAAAIKSHVPRIHTTEDTSIPRVSHDLAAAVLPPSVLHEDETVLVLAKPSLWFILLTSARFIFATVLLSAVIVRIFDLGLDTRISPRQMALFATLAVLVRLAWAALVWTSHVYVLTNRRIITIKGVINVVIFQASLRKIQRTVLYKPWYLRIFNLGTIGFATAATENFDSTWLMIPRSLQTHDQIVAAMNRNQ